MHILKRISIEVAAFLIAVVVSVTVLETLIGGITGELPKIFLFPALALTFWFARAWLTQVVNS